MLMGKLLGGLELARDSVAVVCCLAGSLEGILVVFLVRFRGEEVDMVVDRGEWTEEVPKI